ERLFAGMWDFRRKGWTFRSGGEGPDAPSGSGLYSSSDGGRSWTQLTAKSNRGLPEGPWGRVEVAVAPTDAQIAYALIASTDPPLYRPADGGLPWEPRNKSQNVACRPFYCASLKIDPPRADRLFKPDLDLVVSEDGGRSFSGTGGRAHADWHDLW